MDDKVAWHVNGDGIHQTSKLAAGGTGIKDVWEVPYTIDSGPAAGHTGTVQIDYAHYTPDGVKAAIEAQVGSTHSVASLTS
jgi:hypothetical protein